jgi:hypothetical protein
MPLNRPLLAVSFIRNFLPWSSILYFVEKNPPSTLNYFS